MSANKQQESHKPPSDGSVAKEEFIRVGTTLYKIVEQPRLNGRVCKETHQNNETLRQDYGKDYLATVLQYVWFLAQSWAMWTIVPWWTSSSTSMSLDRALSTARRVSSHPIIGSPHFRGAIRVGDGLSATALPATRSEVTNPAIGIGGTQYRQEYISEFSESSLSEQCNIQHQ